ncbi:MAG: NAD(P)-dependent oxidoreductase, partial [Chloroflexi bacterium]|nr:NAD(P)-dependent oxidoreductase [Chloroflexota bacterium]
MRVGFVGLGKMGRPMASHLVKAGFALTVHSRSRGPVDELVRLGAAAADSPGAVAEATDVVLTCLPTPAIVEQVFLGEKGIVPATRSGQILIDHSTVGPATSRRIAAAAQERGADFLDAPVSGGVVGAQNATLTMMIGGDAATLERALPVLQAMGKNIKRVGDNGQGSVVKLVNQLLVAIHVAAAVEGVVLGVKAGADPRVIHEVIGTSFGASAMLNRTIPMMVDRNFVAGTSIALLLKDLGLIGDVAGEL